MTPQDFLVEAERRLSGAKFAVKRSTLRGAPVVIGRRKPFRARWAFTQLKTSVVVCAVERVTPEGWGAFVDDATRIAREIKGGLPNGLQSGYGAVPVLAGVTVDPVAAHHATQAMPRYELFQGVAMPGLVDLTSRQEHGFTGKQLIGRF